MKVVKPSEEVINNVLNACAAQEDAGGSKVPGMSYEQGVSAAIRWLLGETNDVPLEPAEYEDVR